MDKIFNIQLRCARCDAVLEVDEPFSDDDGSFAFVEPHICESAEQGVQADGAGMRRADEDACQKAVNQMKLRLGSPRR